MRRRRRGSTRRIRCGGLALRRYLKGCVSGKGAGQFVVRDVNVFRIKRHAVDTVWAEFVPGTSLRGSPVQRDLFGVWMRVKNSADR
jgi:hypothetical protein